MKKVYILGNYSGHLPIDSARVCNGSRLETTSLVSHEIEIAIATLLGLLYTLHLLLPYQVGEENVLCLNGGYVKVNLFRLTML